MPGISLLFPICTSALTLVEQEYGPGHNQVDDGYPYESTLKVTPDDPSFARGYQLADAATAEYAVCLDGTPPVYYHREGTGTGANKWFISQQGGGWCDTLASCADRAKGGLGSTKYDGPGQSLNSGYMSLDSETNPMMYNWNAVQLRYCDGGSLTGDQEAPTIVDDTTLHFRGRAILDAQIRSLLNNRGMNQATDVIVSGCSAGGLATFLHCDRWAAAIAAATNGAAKVACVPDSGFFLDEERGPKYHSSMRNVYQTHGSSKDGLNAECVATHETADEEWKCLFAEWVAPHITTPTFALQSQYDSWQSSFVAGACKSLWPPENCDAAIMNEFGRNLTARVQATLLAQSQNGIYLDSCQHHCGLTRTLIDGDSFGAALKKWYEQGSSQLANRGFYNQDRQFPCDDCCNQGPEPKAPNCVQPVSDGCSGSCCNATAYCGHCGECQNNRGGDCAKCYTNGWCFPPCTPCYNPAPPPPASQKYCGLADTCMEDSPCCFGNVCEECMACRDTKTGLCANCWNNGCMACAGCWGWPAPPSPPSLV